MDPDHYYTNEELIALLRTWASNYPQLVSLRQIGESYEKRPIWLLALTNQASGPEESKPAIWIDANLHATEVAGTTTALLVAHTLLEGYAQETHIQRLLDAATFYIAPRVNPDGAALALAASPRFLRSSARPYPWAEKDEGLHQEDIDGDGRILQMRISDPHGDWKVSSLDPRLLEKRAPDEHGGQYYRLLPEGRLEDWDGYVIKLARSPQGLDLNRNFPFEWRTEGEQSDAGPYPTSEPEVQAMVEFITRHPNINFALTYHTFSRVLLRPYSTKSDDDMETADLWVYKAIGEIGSRHTGYRCVSTFHDFKYHPKEVTTGAFDDWLYDHFGLFTFTIELWDLPDEAGIKERKFLDWYRSHPHEEDLQILKWINQHAEGAYVDWYAFQHPQLGPVELGGWDLQYSWRNPPAAFLGAEAARQVPFVLSLGDMLPHLALHTLRAEPLGDDQYRLTLVVENSGFLSTSTSVQARSRKAVRPVRAELELGAGVALAAGKRRVELGHLEGRSNKLEVDTIWEASPTDNRARAEWVLSGAPGATVRVKVASERAGSFQQEITL